MVENMCLVIPALLPVLPVWLALSIVFGVLMILTFR